MRYCEPRRRDGASRREGEVSPAVGTIERIWPLIEQVYASFKTNPDVLEKVRSVGRPDRDGGDPGSLSSTGLGPACLPPANLLTAPLIPHAPILVQAALPHVYRSSSLDPLPSVLSSQLCRLFKHALRAGKEGFAPMLERLIRFFLGSFAESRTSSFLYACAICVSEFGGNRNRIGGQVGHVCVICTRVLGVEVWSKAGVGVSGPASHGPRPNPRVSW